MLRIVVDTNIWIRTLLGGQVSLPILLALREKKYGLVVSSPLLEELKEVTQRPRLKKRIDAFDVSELLDLLEWQGELVELYTIPPRCRDPKDHPVLATAIDGQADAIVTGDDDLRADEELRLAMAEYGVQLWGVQSLLDALETEEN
jgi:putative PIN family toxin of toxin-antitoxin system